MRISPPPFRPILIALAVPLCGAEHTFAQGLAVNLVPSSYNGFAISCFGGRDGSITANVSGGTPPYSYVWSHGDSVAQVMGLPAGYYHVTVLDSDTGRVTVDITLMQPSTLKAMLTPSLFPNDFNISCWNCFNGSLQTTVVGGVPPYQYLWNDGAVTPNRSGLGHKFGYMVEIEDANGCQLQSQRITLTQPDQDGWVKDGNSGTDPQQHYIGTADSADLVIKTSGVERMRFTRDGDLKLIELGEGVISVDENGNAGSWAFTKPWCFPDEPIAPWYLCGNIVNANGTNFIGTVNDVRLPFRTNNIERMQILADGKVSIGSGTAEDQFEVHTTLERSGISIVNQRTDDNSHTAIRFKKNSDERWALGCDFVGTGGQDFFIWDALSNIKRLEINVQGKVGIGTEPPLNGSLYRLYVADGIATRDVKVTAGNWPDFVFADEYSLMPLSELRAFLRGNRHLPGIFSAAEVDREGGVEVGDLQVRLLRVVEEQTLYILQLEERIQALEERRN